MLFKNCILLLTVAVYAAVPSSIVRPCKSIECIRSNLARRSACSPRVSGFVPGEYSVDWFRFDTPFFNATYVDNGLIVRNHDKCYVSEFYYNVKSYTMVLALDCPALEFESTRTVVQHYSLREDVVFDYSYQGTYPLIRLTVTMPLTAPLDLCRAFTFADVTALPTYRVSPNNLRTAKFLSTDKSFLNIFERETFFHRANQLARFYINSVICDFGCNF